MARIPPAPYRLAFAAGVLRALKFCQAPSTGCQRSPGPDPTPRVRAGSGPGALRLHADCCVLLQLGFDGLRLGNKADDAAAITAILDAEVRHQVADAALPRQLRRVVRRLRWRVAGRVRRPPDGVGVSARPRG